MRLLALALLVLTGAQLSQIVLPSRTAFGKFQCLDELSSQPKIHNKLYIGNESCGLRIAAGSRPTDRMLALLLRAILQQWIGYEKVEIQDGDYDYEGWLNATSCNADSRNDCCKTPMLHIGLPEIESQDEKLENYSSHVHSLGELGPRLRRGWFISPETINDTFKISRCWKYFAKPTAEFQFTDHQLNAYTKRTDHPDKRWCDTSEYDKCDNGQFIPEQCRGNQTCATLLAAFPHESYDALVKQITELKLYVKVAWLGKEFEKLVKYHQNNNTLFFDYSTSPLTYNMNKTTEVLFPSCGTLALEKGCIYHSVKLKKFAWYHLKHAAKPAYRLMENFKLTAKEYQKLVEAFGTEPTADDEGLLNMVCNVAKQHWTNMSKWMNNVKVYPEIVVQVFVQNSNSTVPNITNFALDMINKDETILQDFYLNQTVIKGNCNKEAVLNGFKNKSDDETIAMIGPECNGSLTTLFAQMGSTYTVFSYQMDSDTSNNLDQTAQNFFRLTPDISFVYSGYMHLLKYYNWSSFAHFYDKEYVDSSKIARTSNMTIEEIACDRKNTTSSLLTIKKKGNKIIVANFHDETDSINKLVQVMCDAFKLNMTWKEKYVWLFPPWLPKRWFDIPHEELPTGCTKEQLECAMNFTFTYRFQEVEEDNFTINVGFPNVSEWKRTYSKPLSTYDGYAYDAIWTLAKSLSEMRITSIPSLQDSSSREKFISKLIASIRTNEFNGVTGKISFVSEKKTRQQKHILLHQYVNDGEYLEVASFREERPVDPPNKRSINGTVHTTFADYSTDRHANFTVLHEVKWPLGTPKDKEIPEISLHKKKCPAILSFLEEYLECEQIIGGIILLFLITVMFTMFLVFRHYPRKMRHIEQQHQQPFGSLSEYELQDHLVRIYRSLGEGAFGKVYLGQYRNEEGCVLPVAVKAAKDPKNMNAKMELLSEAEVMKKFEHVNILRLIGVITQRNKCMIVTEFMMYGNLKSYLQDRRHLAIKLEIDAAHLTRMALDISRGLSYLASLNYVHGDLACRNCLVHETLTIKIADFGFCKNLVDQDYYRLVRSGPMPVRWMSPELLTSGMYHVQSDIWSFGVVLYEIITFGAYPYGDLDDHQVQEYIRNGGFPTLPHNISSKLEALFLRIWTLKKEDRPTALELFEILAADPELVHPCLEENLSRVDYISLEQQPRRHSRGSAGTLRPHVNRRTRSPHEATQMTAQKMKNETMIEMVRLDQH